MSTLGVLTSTVLCPPQSGFVLACTLALYSHLLESGKQKIVSTKRFFPALPCVKHTFKAGEVCNFYRWRDDLSPAPWTIAPTPESLLWSGFDTMQAPSPARASSTPCISLRCSSTAKPHARHQKCTQSFCKDCCFTTSVHCRVAYHNQEGVIPSPGSLGLFQSPPQPSLAPASFSGPYGKMVDPDYGRKIFNKDFALSPSAHVQSEAYRMEAQKQVKFKIWLSNTEGPMTTLVVVLHYPWLHPRECENITRKLGHPLEEFEFLDVPRDLSNTSEEEEEWINTSSAIKVKVDHVTYMRAPNVHTCLGLHSSTSPRKRAFSPDGDYSLPPPSNTTTPTPSPSPSPTKRARSIPNIRSSSLLNESNEDLSSHTDFPLAYAVEMDAAFHKIQELPAHLGAQLKFNLIFGFLGVPFILSTYSDSWQAWLTTSETEMQRAVACGSAPGGEWTTILCAWRKIKNKSKTTTT
ncbi:hypothetical protein C8R43DRAFT_958116 [Mycena crocata]|nr:hypothetical protein C8R43DRAFT_958116 [Mycena crocata]